ncbi:MAG: Stp1/IreP family PP2C-type Ser/Thr phosphatase [Blastocatellales bacterium]
MCTAMIKPVNENLISVYGCTDVGRRRPNNEDAFLVADLTERGGFTTTPNEYWLGERGALLVVADGMGGASAGEVASMLAVATVRNRLQRSATQANGIEQLRRAAEKANAAIRQYARNRPQAEGMGTTLTAALLRDGNVYLAQVGDSRAYLIRGQRIKQLTKDQSLVQKMLDGGLLTPEEAAHHPYRNVVMQALGVEDEINVALSACTLEPNDFLLLCSDGLSNYVSDAEMQRIVTEAESPKYACRLLVELANERGGADNITVIVAHFDGENLCSSSDRGITASLHI